MKNIITILSILLLVACASQQTQHSVFDRPGEKFGFFVNNTENFVEVKINGMTKIVKPYWASVAHDRDYFEATSPKPWTDRDLKLDTNPDDRFKQVPGKLMANSTETNAFKLYLKPEVMYTLELRELPLADDGRKVVRMEPWRTFIVRLSKESNTPFTLEYGDNE